MADISKVVLPNGNQYNLKDSRVDNIGAYYTSATEMITFSLSGEIPQTVSVAQDSITNELTIT